MRGGSVNLEVQRIHDDHSPSQLDDLGNVIHTVSSSSSPGDSVVESERSIEVARNHKEPVSDHDNRNSLGMSELEFESICDNSRSSPPVLHSGTPSPQIRASLWMPIEECEASPTFRIPSSDLRGALSSLKSSNWLSSTLVELVLAAYGLHDYCILDPSYVPVETPRRLLDKPLLTLKGKTKIIIPMNHRGHWIVAIADFASGLIAWYDSMSEGAIDRQQMQEIVESLSEYLKKHQTMYSLDLSWAHQFHSEMQQCNAFDCGLHLLVWILAQATHQPLPRRVNSTFWREVFRLLIQSGESDTSSSECNPIDVSNLLDFTIPGGEFSTLSQGTLSEELTRSETVLDDACSKLERSEAARIQLHTTAEDHKQSCALLDEAFHQVQQRHVQFSKDCETLTVQSTAYADMQEVLESSPIVVDRDTLDKVVRNGQRNVERCLNEARRLKALASHYLGLWITASHYWRAEQTRVLKQFEYVSKEVQSCLVRVKEYRKKQEDSLNRITSSMQHYVKMSQEFYPG